MIPNMIGAYGPWAAGLAGEGPARLSFRNPKYRDLDAWRAEARDRAADRFLSPDAGGVPKAEVQHAMDFEGLRIEHLSWQLPYGPPTEALFLKPAGASGPLPGVVALHDHGGNKYFGTRKIARMGDGSTPRWRSIRGCITAASPGPTSWPSAGYAVLVHDAYAFASRRVRAGDLDPVLKAPPEVRPESAEEIAAYNTFASDHEHLMAKSLFSAGTTWPGVTLAEDRKALDYLCSRPDVDADRVGCAGLSGGGLRTAYLAGMDDRIRAACCVGMMTTWRDYLLHKCHTHTWMIYVPGLPLDLDYPEVLGPARPLPTLVLNNSDDQLFTLSEMERADAHPGRGVREGGRGRPLPSVVLPGPAQVRPADAGRGVRLLRPLAEGGPLSDPDAPVPALCIRARRPLAPPDPLSRRPHGGSRTPPAAADRAGGRLVAVSRLSARARPLRRGILLGGA